MSNSNSGNSSSTRVIGVAVDGGEHAQYAFHWAMQNLIVPTDDVVIINIRPTPRKGVVHGLDINSPYNLSKELDEAIDIATREESDKILSACASRLRAHTHDPQRIHTVSLQCDDAREGIERAVVERGIGVLVVGSRGPGGGGAGLRFRTVSIGSVSRYLVEHLQVPVIVPKLPSVLQP